MVDARSGAIRAVNRIVPPGPYGAIMAGPYGEPPPYGYGPPPYGAPPSYGMLPPYGPPDIVGPEMGPEEADLGLGPPMGPGMGPPMGPPGLPPPPPPDARPSMYPPAAGPLAPSTLVSVPAAPSSPPLPRPRPAGFASHEAQPAAKPAEAPAAKPDAAPAASSVAPRRRRLPRRRNDRNSPRRFRTDWSSRPPILLALPRPLHRPVSELRRFARNDSLVVDDVVLERRRSQRLRLRSGRLGGKRHGCRHQGCRRRGSAAKTVADVAADTGVTVAARLDRLPPSRHTHKLITLLSLGAWFEFDDLFFTAYVAIGLFKEGIFTPTTQGLFDLHGVASFVAALFAGMFIGTLAFSWLSDRFGRRSIFTFALLWYSVRALTMAFQTTPETINLWRLIASIGLGVELVNVDAYLSELVPKEQRGVGLRL